MRRVEGGVCKEGEELLRGEAGSEINKHRLENSFNRCVNMT